MADHEEKPGATDAILLGISLLYSQDRKKYTSMHPYMYCFLFQLTNQVAAFWSCDLPGSAHPLEGPALLGAIIDHKNEYLQDIITEEVFAYRLATN